MYKELATNMINSLLTELTKETNRIVVLAKTVKLNSLRNELATIADDKIITFLFNECAKLSGAAISEDTTTTFAQFNAVQSVYEFVASF